MVYGCGVYCLVYDEFACALNSSAVALPFEPIAFHIQFKPGSDIRQTFNVCFQMACIRHCSNFTLSPTHPSSPCAGVDRPIAGLPAVHSLLSSVLFLCFMVFGLV